jgi:hypothetical protein
MKIIVLVFAIALAGCMTIAPTTLSTAEKSLTIAHLAYNGIGESLKASAESGVLVGMNAATAKSWFDKAGDALLVADKADAAANAQGILDAIILAEEAIAQANALVSPKK